MINRKCKICENKHAPYGFGVDLSRNKAGVWYCFEHIPKPQKKDNPVRATKTKPPETEDNVNSELWYHDQIDLLGVVPPAWRGVKFLYSVIQKTDKNAQERA